jgi:hypothetical protein
MSEMKNRRKRSFVDAAVQWGLVVRIILYWIVFMFDSAATLVLWRLVTSPMRDFNTHLEEIWCDYAPVLLVSFLLLPMGIVDIVRFSNRFVGPLLRLRRSMRRLAHGEYVAPIRFRNTDYWQEFADEFNAVLARVQGPPAAEGHESAAEKEELIAVA